MSFFVLDAARAMSVSTNRFVSKMGHGIGSVGTERFVP